MRKDVETKHTARPLVSKTIRIGGYSFYFLFRARKLKTRKDEYGAILQRLAAWPV